MSFPRSRKGGMSMVIVLIRYSKSSRKWPFEIIDSKFLLVAEISLMSICTGVLLPNFIIVRF